MSEKNLNYKKNEKENLKIYANEIKDFFDESPSNYYVIESLRKMLLQKGFEELNEKEKRNLDDCGKYFVVKDEKALFAFKNPAKMRKGMKIAGSHSDSPGFSIKGEKVFKDGGFFRINVEEYGGAIESSRLDRTLSFSGIVYFENAGKIDFKKVKIDKDLFFTANAAIHMNREINKGFSYNVQKHIQPFAAIYEKIKEEDFLLNLLEKHTEISKEKIIRFDLTLFDRQKAAICGVEKEFIQSGRIDNQAAVFSSAKALLNEEIEDFCAIVVNDAEEIGSLKRTGARGSFLNECLNRIKFLQRLDEEEFYISLSKSFMISFDQSHSVNPSYPEYEEPLNKVYAGGGVALKIACNGSYANDLDATAVVKNICKNAFLNLQIFYNRSDKPGGTTIGPLTSALTGIKTIDLGAPIFAMHSIRETAALSDLYESFLLIEEFFKGENYGSL